MNGMKATVKGIEGNRGVVKRPCRRRSTAALLLPVLLACAVAAAQQTAQQAAPGQNTTQSKAESDAYTAALKTADATARAEALAAFVQDYPQSTVLTNALEQEMAAWQGAGDSGQVKKTAQRLLDLDHGNIRALGIVVALDRASAMRGDLTALNEMCADASGGMLAVPMWRKPANMAQADFVSLSKLMSALFTGAEGYCMVENKDYSQGKKWLAQALQIDPTNAQDTYELAVADLETTPLDVNGFWYCGRAIHLTESAAFQQDASSMEKYCKAKYTDYHGGEDGWDALVEASSKEDAPPGDFEKQVKPAQK